MKRISSILCILIFLLFLTSCRQVRKVEKHDEFDEYKEQISIFTDIWRASSLPNGLHLGDIWDTDAFSMMFSEAEHGISINFETYDYSISECFDDGNIFMNAITCGSDHESYLFDGELFYMMALFDHVDEHSASVTINNPGDADAIMIIVIVDGIVYNEMVFLS